MSDPLTECFGHLDVHRPDGSVTVAVVPGVARDDGQAHPVADLILRFDRAEVTVTLEAADARALAERLLAAVDE